MENMKIGGNIGGGMPPPGFQKQNTMAPPMGNPMGNPMGDPMGNQMFGGSIAEPTIQPQNPLPIEETTTGGAGEELDAEFLQEIETYLKECMENNELSIDMSDTLIQDHGAKMVAAAASLCDQLQELRLQQCGITDEGAIELFNELKVLKQLQVIDISFNPITEKSLDALSDLLNNNQ